MPTSGWLLVDTLEKHRLTVIARDHDPKDRISLERLVTEKVGGRAPGKEATRWLESVIATIRDSGTRIDDGCTLQNGQNLTVHGIPVLGPDKTLHAVQMWIGPSTEKPKTPPVPAYGFTWDTVKRLAEVPPALARPIGGEQSVRSTLTAPEIFRFMDVPASLPLVRAMLTAQPASVWQGAVTIRTPGHHVPAHMVMMSGETEDDGSLWRGVLFETSQASEPGAASLELAMMAAVPKVSQTHMVLMDVAKMRLIRWLTDPLSGVQWKGMVDNRDAPHPDDVKRIFAAAAEVFTGQSETAHVDGIRLRRFGGGWLVVNGSGAAIHTPGDGPTLAVIQLDVVGESDEPDPVPVDDQGLPGLE